MPSASRGRTGRFDGVAAQDPGAEAEADQPYRRNCRRFLNRRATVPNMERILTRWLDIPNLRDIDVYLAHDGYAAARKAFFDMKPEEIIDEVKNSTLRGRGGAAFPTGMKWSFI